MKISRIISIGLAIIFILAVARLNHLDKGGPAHVYVMLPGNETRSIRNFPNLRPSGHRASC
jgi:hypothetical protein